MTFTTWRIDRVPFVNNDWVTASRETITSYYNPLLVVGLGDSRDTFKFSLLNTSNKYDSKFNTNDKVFIYRTINSATVDTDTDILMVGTIKDNNRDRTYKIDKLTPQGYNFSESVLSAIIFADFTNKTIPEAIKLALDNASGFNSNFKVTWNSNNPTVRTDGTQFPTVGQRYFNKPLRKLVEDYSTNEKTGDGNYYWYINQDNEFVWRPGNDASFDSYSFDANTDKYQELKIELDDSQIINYLVLKGGIGPNGKQIQTKYVDWTSVAKHGQKFGFIVSETNNAKNLTALDIGGNNPTTNYPDLASSFTTLWTSSVNKTLSGGTVMVEGYYTVIDTGTEAGNKQDYNQAISAEIIARLKSEGKRYADLSKYGQLIADITFKSGQKPWRIGDKIACILPSVSSKLVNLRVNTVQFSSTTDTYTLKLDKGKAMPE